MSLAADHHHKHEVFFKPLGLNREPWIYCMFTLVHSPFANIRLSRSPTCDVKETKDSGASPDGHVWKLEALFWMTDQRQTLVFRLRAARQENEQKTAIIK